MLETVHLHVVLWDHSHKRKSTSDLRAETLRFPFFFLSHGSTSTVFMDMVVLKAKRRYACLVRHYILRSKLVEKTRHQRLALASRNTNSPSRYI